MNAIIPRSPRTVDDVGTVPSFVRLTLLEAAKWGMPKGTVTMLDSMAAALGLYAPLSQSQVDHMKGPIVTWEDRHSRAVHHIDELQNLVTAERVAVAFGLSQYPHAVIGPAELLRAMLNTCPEGKDLIDLFHWAMQHAFATVYRVEPETIAKAAKHRVVTHDEVLSPSGALHPAYLRLAKHLRTQAIEHEEKRRREAVDRSDLDTAVARMLAQLKVTAEET
jgi:hypothetical protein